VRAAPPGDAGAPAAPAARGARGPRTGPAGREGPAGGGPPYAWRASPRPEAAFDCGRSHPAGNGLLDERARRLSHEEYSVARLLAGEGHSVSSLPESRQGRRMADLSACGSAVEVKSFLSLDERRRPPSAQSVHNKLLDATGQGSHLVLVGHGSGLRPETVRQGLARYAADPRVASPLRSVRVLGDGFDLGWTCGPVPSRARVQAGRDGVAERGL
jgi:hypothetical protein